MRASEALEDAELIILDAIHRIKDSMASGDCGTTEAYNDAVGASKGCGILSRLSIATGPALSSPRHTRRAAIMRRAHQTYSTMNWKGPSDWTFARCLRLAHAEIAGKRNVFVFAQIEEQMRRLVGEGDLSLRTPKEP